MHRLEEEPKSGLEQIIRHIQSLAVDFLPGVKEARTHCTHLLHPQYPPTHHKKVFVHPGSARVLRRSAGRGALASEGCAWFVTAAKTAGEVGRVVGTLPPPLLGPPAALRLR